MCQREIDGFDVDLKLDQIADVFVVAGCCRVDGRRPDFGFQRLADRQELGGDRFVIDGHDALFQIGDRLAGLFFFEEGGIVGVGGQTDLVTLNMGDQTAGEVMVVVAV